VGVPQKNTIKEYAPESYYHVYSRGTNKQPIFLDKRDYDYFISLLERYLSSAQKFSRKDGVAYPTYRDDIQLEAYCLMRNHFHFLIYTNHDGELLGRFMASLKTSYSMYFNLRHKRVGSVFESRYKAKLIHDQSYLIHIHRYIHLNPRRWRTHRYSSFKLIFAQNRYDWLKPSALLAEFDCPEDYLNFLADYEDHKGEAELLKYMLADQQ
jgi:putative transposase